MCQAFWVIVLTQFSYTIKTKGVNIKYERFRKD